MIEEDVNLTDINDVVVNMMGFFVVVNIIAQAYKLNSVDFKIVILGYTNDSVIGHVIGWFIKTCKNLDNVNV